MTSPAPRQHDTLRLPTSAEPARGRSAARAWLATLGIVVLLGGLALVADRVAASVASQHATSWVERELAGQDVETTVHGFPFLTQLVSGELQDADLTAGRLTWHGFTVEDVTAHASGVATDGRSIASTEISGLIPTATLQSLTDHAIASAFESTDVVPVTVTAGDGVLTASMTAIGSIQLATDLVPVAQPRAIGFTVTQVRLGGLTITPSDLPFGLGDLLTERLAGLTVSLADLPEGLELTGIEMHDDGAHVTMTGTDVVLPVS